MYRLRRRQKKIAAKVNSDSAEMILMQEAGPSKDSVLVTTAPLMQLSPDAGPLTIQHKAVIEIVELPSAKLKRKVREEFENFNEVHKLKKAQRLMVNENLDEICQLPSQSIPTSHLPDNEMRQISNQHVENLKYNELIQSQTTYVGDVGENLYDADMDEHLQLLLIENEDDFNVFTMVDEKIKQCFHYETNLSGFLLSVLIQLIGSYSKKSLKGI